MAPVDFGKKYYSKVREISTNTKQVSLLENPNQLFEIFMK